MSEHNKDLSPAELRKFGWVTGILIIVLIGGLVPWLWDKNILEWQKITGPVGGVLIVWALIHPASLVFIYKPWMWLADKIGWVNTRIIMMLIFYVMFTPIGLVMRLFGHDPMHRRFEKDSVSYRKNKEAQPKDHMETPF